MNLTKKIPKAVSDLFIIVLSFHDIYRPHRSQRNPNIFELFSVVCPSDSLITEIDVPIFSTCGNSMRSTDIMADGEFLAFTLSTCLLNKIMKDSIKTKLNEALKNEIKAYLQENQFLDTVFEKGQFYEWSGKPKKPSEMNIDFNYDYLSIRDPHWENIVPNEYKTNYCAWTIPLATKNLLKLHQIHTQLWNINFEGTTGEIKFNVKYDQNTGDPIIDLIKADLNTEFKRV
ncbi:MAG: hypothetical protein IPK88_18395 [Saprospiraceae bacterium]|nr:hypothetical protein [Candidatus Defluviibacterium haderslevense]